MNALQSPHGDIIMEMRTLRERLAKQYGNDLLAYSRAAEAHCRDLGFTIVESPRRQPIQEPPLKQAEIAA